MEMDQRKWCPLNIMDGIRRFAILRLLKFGGGGYIMTLNGISRRKLISSISRKYSTMTDLFALDATERLLDNGVSDSTASTNTPGEIEYIFIGLPFSLKQSCLSH